MQGDIYGSIFILPHAATQFAQHHSFCIFGLFQEHWVSVVCGITSASSVQSHSLFNMSVLCSFSYYSCVAQFKSEMLITPVVILLFRIDLVFLVVFVSIQSLRLSFFSQDVMVHTFNSNTWEAEASGSLSWRPAWST